MATIDPARDQNTSGQHNHSKNDKPAHDCVLSIAVKDHAASQTLLGRNVVRPFFVTMSVALMQ